MHPTAGSVPFCIGCGGKGMPLEASTARSIAASFCSASIRAACSACCRSSHTCACSRHRCYWANLRRRPQGEKRRP